MFLKSDFPRKRNLSWIRVLLAAVAAAVTSVSTGRLTPAVAVLALYFAASLVEAIRGEAKSRLLALLALFADTVYFLVLAYFADGRLEWLSAAFFLYLLVEALVFSGPVEVAVIAAGAAIFCAVLPAPRAQALVPMVVWRARWRAGFAVIQAARGGSRR